MAAYKAYFRESVEKELSVIPKKDLKRILQRIEMLADNPRLSGYADRREIRLLEKDATVGANATYSWCRFNSYVGLNSFP